MNGLFFKSPSDRSQPSDGDSGLAGWQVKTDHQPAGFNTSKASSNSTGVENDIFPRSV